MAHWITPVYAKNFPRASIVRVIRYRFRRAGTHVVQQSGAYYSFYRSMAGCRGAAWLTDRHLSGARLGRDKNEWRAGEKKRYMYSRTEGGKRKGGVGR